MSRIEKQYERVKREIEILCSDQYLTRNIIYYLQELEDYISIRVEGLEKEVERDE